MERVKGKTYTQVEVAKRVKCIEGVYYIDVTEEGKKLFGETIIENALVRLDLSWVLRKYMPREYMDEHLEEEYHSKIIKREGVGVAFESIVNEIFEQKDIIQFHNMEGSECLVIRFTNGKEMFISNSEWGEIRPKF